MIDENHNAVGFENGTQLPVAHRAHRQLQEASLHAESDSKFLHCKQAIEPGVRVEYLVSGTAWLASVVRATRNHENYE